MKKNKMRPENPEMEPVYLQEKDLPAVIKQIVVDLKELGDQELYNKWDIRPNDLKKCDVKIFGNGQVSLEVFETVGGFRSSYDAPELRRREAETKRLLDKFEKALRKEFKERTGKNFKLSNANILVNREKVALNGLYRFFAIKLGDLKVELDGQSWSDDE